MQPKEILRYVGKGKGPKENGGRVVIVFDKNQDSEDVSNDAEA